MRQLLIASLLLLVVLAPAADAWCNQNKQPGEASANSASFELPEVASNAPSFDFSKPDPSRLLRQLDYTIDPNGKTVFLVALSDRFTPTQARAAQAGVLRLLTDSMCRPGDQMVVWDAAVSRVASFRNSDRVTDCSRNRLKFKMTPENKSAIASLNQYFEAQKKANHEGPAILVYEAVAAVFGDTVFANVLMLGYAWQLGLVPLEYAAIKRAIELNAVAVEQNVMAFKVGRIACVDPNAFDSLLDHAHASEETLDEIVAECSGFLAEYQDDAYASSYRASIARLLGALPDNARESLGSGAARALFKLMAYKDEYEVARLHNDAQFLADVNAQFEEGFSINYHLAPPLLPSATDARGRPRKREFGAWFGICLKVLKRLKGLRGSPLDLFGYTAERRMERELIAWYQLLLDRCAQNISEENAQAWSDVIHAPLDIRGYGPVKQEAVETAKLRVQRALAAITE